MPSFKHSGRCRVHAAVFCLVICIIVVVLVLLVVVVLFRLVSWALVLVAASRIVLLVVSE